MANPEHVEVVKKGVVAIAEWRSQHHGAILSLGKANLSEADLGGADLGGADLSEAILGGADLSRAKLSGADLSRAKLIGANLWTADLFGADLSGANLSEARLVGADLTGTLADSATSLLRASVRHCRIDRHTLESLKDFGGLTNGDRMLMDIVDGVAKLRASFSGFWQWVHLAALAAFLFPYAWFIGKHWSLARFGVDETEPTISLFAALMRFIWNGGENWRAGAALNVLPFGIFVYSLIYNALRGVLLWKTKTLELKQEASGLPAVFSLTGWWGRMYQASKWGMYANLLFVAWHTYYFLGQRIPLGE